MKAEEREKVVPQLGNNPTCRNIRDSIVNLCSRKLDKNEVKPQYFQVDPKTVLKAKGDIDLSLKELSLLLDKYNKAIKDENTAYARINSVKAKECNNQLSEVSDSIYMYENDKNNGHNLDHLKKSLNKISKNCIDKLSQIADQKKQPQNFAQAALDLRMNIQQLKEKLVDSETAASVQNAGVDIYNFTKESPCESLRIDYNNEGDLDKITIVKRPSIADKFDEVDGPITYKVSIDDSEYNNVSEKDSVSCRPNLSTDPKSNYIGRDTLQVTEFGKELLNVVNRTQNTDLFTPPDNRRAPVQTNEGQGKN